MGAVRGAHAVPRLTFSVRRSGSFARRRHQTCQFGAKVASTTVARASSTIGVPGADTGTPSVGGLGRSPHAQPEVTPYSAGRKSRVGTRAMQRLALVNAAGGRFDSQLGSTPAGSIAARLLTD